MCLQPTQAVMKSSKDKPQKTVTFTAPPKRKIGRALSHSGWRESASFILPVDAKRNTLPHNAAPRHEHFFWCASNAHHRPAREVRRGRAGDRAFTLRGRNHRLDRGVPARIAEGA